MYTWGSNYMDAILANTDTVYTHAVPFIFTAIIIMAMRMFSL